MLHELQRAIDAQLKPAVQRVKENGWISSSPLPVWRANLAEVIYLDRTGRPLPQLNLAKISFKGNFEDRKAVGPIPT